MSLPADPGPCPECGEPRRRVTVATLYVMAVCPTSVEHVVFEEIRGGEADWAGEDRWWRMHGEEPPIPASGPKATA